MQKFFDVIQARTGDALANVTVTVYNSAGNAATLYSDNGVTVKANPTTTNADGEYSFYAANGTYSLTISNPGYTTETRTGILLYDAADGTSATLGYNEGAANAVTRTVQNKLQESISVKDFGAKGDGTTDDTAAIWNAIQAINDAGGGALFFPQGTYLISYNVKAAITSTQAWATSFKAVPGLNQFTLVFCNCNGLKVFGDDAIIKSKNNGIPTESITGYEWAQMILRQCLNVEITGLTFDGNRANQLHTVGLNVGFNANLSLESYFATGSEQPNENIWIHHNTMKNGGSLRPSDKRGDGVFGFVGDKNITIEDNHFENVGRWAIALEGGSNGVESNGFYVLRNTFKSNQRGTDPVNPDIYGFIDIETTTSYSNIVIDGNHVYNGTCFIAFGGDAGNKVVTAKNIRITNNIFESVTGVPNGSHRLMTLSSGGNESVNYYREFSNFIVSNNVVTNTGSFAMLGFVDVAQCRIKDFYVESNVFSEQTTGTVAEGTYGGVRIYYADMLGTISIQNNVLHRTGSGIKIDHPLAKTGSGIFILNINNNLLDYPHQGITCDNSSTDYVGSQIIVTGNTVSNGTYYDSYLNSGNIEIQQYNNKWSMSRNNPEWNFGVTGNATPLETYTKNWSPEYGGKRTGWFRSKTLITSSTVVLRIKKNALFPAANGTVTFGEIGDESTTARITFDYHWFSGAWVVGIATVTSKANGIYASPTITPNGEYLDIAWSKYTGTNRATIVYDINIIRCDLEIPQS
jgi:polygalacturonase